MNTRWDCTRDDTGIAFQGAEGGAALAGLVDVASHADLAIGSLVSLGLGAFTGPARRTEDQGRAVRVKLLESFAGSKRPGLVERLLDGLFGVQHGAGQPDVDLDGHGVFLAFDEGGGHGLAPLDKLLSCP
jgi:hypothetical protein